MTYARGRRVTIERSDGGPLLAEYDGEVWAPAGPTITTNGSVPATARVTFTSRGLGVAATSDTLGGTEIEYLTDQEPARHIGIATLLDSDPACIVVWVVW